MAGDEEDGGGELRKLNKENEHEKKEVGGLNVSIVQNEYSKVALKNMLEIRKARISEISSQVNISQNIKQRYRFLTWEICIITIFSKWRIFFNQLKLSLKHRNNCKFLIYFIFILERK